MRSRSARNSLLDSGELSPTPKSFRLLGVVLIILISQLTITTYQLVRYEVDVYDCSDMSKDCEAFFESIGWNTWMILGERDNGSNHVWLIVDTPLFPIEFESTCLIPISPRVMTDYDNLCISDGFLKNDKEINNVYNDW